MLLYECFRHLPHTKAVGSGRGSNGYKRRAGRGANDGPSALVSAPSAGHVKR